MCEHAGLVVYFFHACVCVLFAGLFEWQVCHVSSGPKEQVSDVAVPLLHTAINLHCCIVIQKLTIHIPFSEDIWFKKAFAYLKEHPHNMPQNQSKSGGRQKNPKRVENEAESLSMQFPAYLTGPYVLTIQ